MPNVTRAVKSLMNDAKAQLMQAEQRLVQAQKTHDVAALEELLHNDLLFIGPSGTVFTKSMDIESHRIGSMLIEKMEATVEQVNMIGDNAVTVVIAEVSGAVGEKRVDGTIRYIRVWKRCDDGWKVIGGSFAQLK